MESGEFKAGSTNDAGAGKRWRTADRAKSAFPLLTYLLVFLFPMLFMGKILSANDIYRHYDPWRSDEPTVAQNPTLHDPALAWLPIIEMARDDPSTFHWNPYLASGIPGWGSAASALTTPLLLPLFVLPGLFFYVGMVLIKLLSSWFFAKGWLCEEGFGPGAAGVGALVVAAAGPAASSWLWQSSNATVLYPALLWAIARAFNGKRTSIVLLSLLAFSFAVSGYPATIIFGLWLGIVACVLGLVRGGRIRLAELARFAGAGFIGAALAAPFVAPFIRFVRESGYLERREEFAVQLSFPFSHIRGLIDHAYLGSPASRDWRGLEQMGPANNPAETTIFLGFLVVLLALWAFRRLTTRRFGWGIVALVALWLMFGLPGSELFRGVPGIEYSPMTRLRLILAVPFGFLAAAGFEALPSRTAWLRWLLAGAVAIELALFAGGFYGWLEPDDARIPAVESVALLKSDSPSRVLPLFDWLQPNAAQLYGVEDIRSQWSSEERYREILAAIDPSSAGEGTVIRFNALTTDLEHPLLDMLGVEWIVEPPAIEIVRWKVEERLTRPQASGARITLEEGESIGTPLSIGRDVEALALKLAPESGAGEVVITFDEMELATRSFDDLRGGQDLFVAVPRELRGASGSLEVRVGSGAISAPLDVSDGLLVGQSRSSLVHDRTTAEGRFYRRMGALPRFWPVHRLDDRPLSEVLVDRSFDYEDVAQVTGPVETIEAGSRARVRIGEWTPSRSVVTTSSEGRFLLASSEKLDPDLEIIVDGQRAKPLRINGVFAGVIVEPGEHEVVFERRLGRGFWPFAFVALATLAIIAAYSFGRRRRVAATN